MHELSITQNIVSIVKEKSGGRKVLRVQLEIGTMSAVVPDSVRFCFDVCARGTSLDGAELEIIEVSPLGRCNTCSLEFPLELLAARCPCGSRDIICIAGQELKIKEMEVE